MSLDTAGLNAAFLRPFESQILLASDVSQKPLSVDLRLPLPPRLRVYMYSLVGGTSRSRDEEYKAVLRLRGQRKGAYASFDHSGDRVALVVGYRDDFDVFVLWDASLHHRFKNGTNIQVHTDTVMKAVITGQAEQLRRLVKMRTTETVLACQSRTLLKTVARRVALTGGTDNVGSPV